MGSGPWKYGNMVGYTSVGVGILFRCRSD